MEGDNKTIQDIEVFISKALNYANSKVITEYKIMLHLMSRINSVFTDEEYLLVKRNFKVEVRNDDTAIPKNLFTCMFIQGVFMSAEEIVKNEYVGKCAKYTYVAGHFFVIPFADEKEINVTLKFEK